LTQNPAGLKPRVGEPVLSKSKGLRPPAPKILVTYLLFPPRTGIFLTRFVPTKREVLDEENQRLIVSFNNTSRNLG